MREKQEGEKEGGTQQVVSGPCGQILTGTRIRLSLERIG